MDKQIELPTPLGIVVCQATSNSEIELFKGDLDCTMPNGMTVDKSTAVVLFVNSESTSTWIKLSATLKNPIHEGFPATGQNLGCIEFLDEKYHLTFGTEDDEMLRRRMPDVFDDSFSYPIAYNRSGMTLELDDLHPNKKYSFHLVVSYKKLPDEQECSAWFFAEIVHETALIAISQS